MNPLIPSTSPLFLPLSQLTPHCTRLLNSLKDDRVSSKERILYEQTLWNEVKKIRASNDTSIFLYLIGFYHTILYQEAENTAHNDLLQYHVLIRLGDLNRYMDRTDVAEYYYCNARNLFPSFGHAYNQLGLLTKPTNCYKCCYYYARAAKSSEKPLNTIADSNLRIAVSKYDCEILNHILNDVECLGDDEEKGFDNKLPGTAFDWFYVIVVAIYANNIKPIVKPFLKYLNENFSTQKATTIKDGVKITRVGCDRDAYILLAGLDILLDWLKLGSQGKVIWQSINPEMRQIRSYLQTILISCEGESSLIRSSVDNSGGSNTTSTSTTLDSTRMSINLSGSNSALQDYSNISSNNSSSSNSSKTASALLHDHVLRGFSPLERVHAELNFERRIRGKMEENSVESLANYSKFFDTGKLLQLVCRLRSKIDSFGPLMRRQTRNIALESILSNLDKSVV